MKWIFFLAVLAVTLSAHSQSLTSYSYSSVNWKNFSEFISPPGSQSISLIVDSSEYGMETSTNWLPAPDRFNPDSPTVYYINLLKLKRNDTLLVIVGNDTLTLQTGNQ